MLVLTRKKEEKLVIGDNITLTILKIKGNSVQIGVEAPRHVRVLRSELAAPSEAASEENETQSATGRPTRRVDGVNRLRQLAGQVNQDRVAATTTVQLV